MDVTRDTMKAWMLEKVIENIELGDAAQEQVGPDHVVTAQAVFRFSTQEELDMARELMPEVQAEAEEYIRLKKQTGNINPETN